MTPKQQSKVFSLSRLSAIVIGTVLLASLLIPDDKELISRLDKDGEIQRLRQLAAERMKEHHPTQPQPKTEAEELRQWLTDSDTSVRTDPAILAERKNRVTVTENPAALAAELQTHGDSLEPELYAALADALAKRSLGLGKPAIAGTILNEWCRRYPSWPTAMRAVQAWRWAVKSEHALEAIDQCINAKLPLDSDQAPPDLEELRISLALESNQPNHAFDIVFSRFNSTPPERRCTLLKRLVELASTGDRTNEAARLIEEHLAQVPFHTSSLTDALQLARTGKAFPNPEEEKAYRSYATALAHWREWGGQGSKAFEPWLRLSILGEEEAWSRVSELYVDLLRDTDYITVLAERISQGKSRQERGKLALILAQQGQAETAVSMYQQALKDNPTTEEQAHLIRGLCHLHQEQANWAKAVESWTALLKLLPEDREAQKGRGYAHIRMGHYIKAKADYLWLSEHHPEDASIHEDCACLCDSLGDEKSATQCLKRLLAVSGRPSTPEEHIELAGRFHLLHQNEEGMAALRDGLVDHPESIRIRHILAESLATAQNYDESVRVLAYGSMAEHAPSMSLLIDLCSQASNRHLALRFLNGRVPRCLNSDYLAQFRLALLLEQTGEIQQAEKIIAHLKDDETHKSDHVWHELAKLCMESGDPFRAETFQKLHLEHSGKHDSRAWELMGDIFQSQERGDEAKTAYQQAISVITPEKISKN
jgi:tetratricopeptide (TPR) repeat protein